MSQQNVEVIRRIWEEWNRGDLNAVFALYAPDVEFDVTRYPEWPDADIARGREPVRRFFTEFLATWESYEGTLETLLDAGDDRVFAIIRQRFRGRGSGAGVEMHWAQIYTLRDGVIFRIQNFSDRAEALEAVGMKE
jgi:ketosteroid isomerase-like protein